MKNIFKIIAFLVVSIIIFSCNLNPWGPDTPIEQDTTRSDGFYPLQVGNEWHYYTYNAFSYNSDTTIYSLDSVVIVDNKKYYVIKLFEPWSDAVFGRQMIREENGIVYWLFGKDEYVCLDTSKEINESWSHIPKGWTRRIISKNDSINTMHGTIYNCISVIDESTMDSTLRMFAPRIGLIYTEVNYKDGYSIGAPKVLIWARIINRNVNLGE